MNKWYIGHIKDAHSEVNTVEDSFVRDKESNVSVANQA